MQLYEILIKAEYITWRKQQTKIKKQEESVQGLTW